MRTEDGRYVLYEGCTTIHHSQSVSPWAVACSRTVDVDRSEGAINEKLESRGKVFVGLVFARRRNALLKLLDRDLAVLQCKRRKRYPASSMYMA